LGNIIDKRIDGEIKLLRLMPRSISYVLASERA